MCNANTNTACSPNSVLAGLQDVKATTANDDQYFVFEDMLYQVLFVFSRDTHVLRALCSHSPASPNPSAAAAAAASNAGPSPAAPGARHRTYSPPRCNLRVSAAATRTSPSASPAHTSASGADSAQQQKQQQQTVPAVYPPNGVIPFHGFSTLGTPSSSYYIYTSQKFFHL